MSLGVLICKISILYLELILIIFVLSIDICQYGISITAVRKEMLWIEIITYDFNESWLEDEEEEEEDEADEDGEERLFSGSHISLNSCVLLESF